VVCPRLGHALNSRRAAVFTGRNPNTRKRAVSSSPVVMLHKLLR
jgi:hypothetical protein